MTSEVINIVSIVFMISPERDHCRKALVTDPLRQPEYNVWQLSRKGSLPKGIGDVDLVDLGAFIAVRPERDHCRKALVTSFASREGDCRIIKVPKGITAERHW